MVTYEEIMSVPPVISVQRLRTAPRWPIRRLELHQAFAVPLDQEKALRAAAAHVNNKGTIKVSVRKGIDAVWCVRIA